MEKITITIEIDEDENTGKVSVRLAGDPSPEKLGGVAKNIRAIALLAAANAINSVFIRAGAKTEVTK